MLDFYVNLILAIRLIRYNNGLKNIYVNTRLNEGIRILPIFQFTISVNYELKYNKIYKSLVFKLEVNKNFHFIALLITTIIASVVVPCSLHDF